MERQLYGATAYKSCTTKSFQKSHMQHLKPGLHEPQLPVERRVALVSSIVVERRRCALQVSSVARLQENKET